MSENGEDAPRIWLFTSGECGGTNTGACIHNVDGDNTSCEDVDFIRKKATFTGTYHFILQ